MCASCCIAWAIRCSARGGDWPEPMPASRIVGIGTPIPTLKKAHRKNWALIFTDEASFRQDTTLHATWSRVGRAPEFRANTRSLYAAPPRLRSLLREEFLWRT